MLNKLYLGHFEKHIKDMVASIDLLYKLGRHTQARYLGFILIDQLAWLVRSNETTGEYFRDWVGKFLIPYDSNLTPDEVWASRNANLHNNSTKSRDTEGSKNVNQLVFVDNTLMHLDYSSCNQVGKKAINGNKFLNNHLINAVEDFLQYLKQGQNYNQNQLNERLGWFLGKHQIG